MELRERRVSTTHGNIYVVESGDLASACPTLFLVHGNSSSSMIFRHILQSPAIIRARRIVSFDLPGHGSSSQSPNPERTYTMRGYAECALEVLMHLQVQDVVVLGWSLGGHIGIEMIPIFRSKILPVFQESPGTPTMSLQGLMLVGTPPALGAEQITMGFLKEEMSPYMHLTGQEHLTIQEAFDYAYWTTGSPFETWQQECVAKTDGRSRRIMFSTFTSGIGVDQVKVVEEEKDVLVGVVNGAEEPFVNLEYLDRLRWGRLWEDKCLRMDGLGHAPFWQQPEEFETILVSFLEDCERDRL